MFSMRIWIRVSSAARPISPPMASSSRTRWPLPVPPMEGLQGIMPMLSRFRVSRAVLRPIRAAARAASQPPCPAPITTQSKRSPMRGLIVRSSVIRAYSYV